MGKELNVRHFVEISTSRVYESKSKKRQESSRIKPVDLISKYRF
jgi:hypothetical protein